MNTVIIDYGSGNLRSAAKAFERCASEAQLAGSITVSSDPKLLASASHIVLPGVGAYGDCMRGIQAIDGLLPSLTEQVHIRKKWFLGICVGMQLMLTRGFEHGQHSGLGWMEGEVVKLGDGQWAIGNGNEASRPSSGGNLKIPHMGWNELHLANPASPLLKGIAEGAHAYFVHSYHAVCPNTSDVMATTDYGGAVTAIIGRENMFGTQFHPEKSQETGLRLIRNFLEL